MNIHVSYIAAHKLDNYRIHGRSRLKYYNQVLFFDFNLNFFV